MELPQLTCLGCGGLEAAAAKQKFPSFEIAHVLIDESHHRITLRRCPVCTGLWVQTFSETVDFRSGDDAQYWLRVPVTVAEADGLIATGEGTDSEQIAVLARSRRWLSHDHPSGGCATTMWRNGEPPGEHHD